MKLIKTLFSAGALLLASASLATEAQQKALPKLQPGYTDGGSVSVSTQLAYPVVLKEQPAANYL
ncbi:MAG: hypothetical protein CSB28_01820, partial [Desulfobacterales bacterium]